MTIIYDLPQVLLFIFSKKETILNKIWMALLVLSDFYNHYNGAYNFLPLPAKYKSHVFIFKVTIELHIKSKFGTEC